MYWLLFWGEMPRFQREPIKSKPTVWMGWWCFGDELRHFKFESHDSVYCRGFNHNLNKTYQKYPDFWWYFWVFHKLRLKKNSFGDEHPAVTGWSAPIFAGNHGPAYCTVGSPWLAILLGLLWFTGIRVFFFFVQILSRRIGPVQERPRNQATWLIFTAQS